MTFLGKHFLDRISLLGTYDSRFTMAIDHSEGGSQLNNKSSDIAEEAIFGGIVFAVTTSGHRARDTLTCIGSKRNFSNLICTL